MKAAAAAERAHEASNRFAATTDDQRAAMLRAIADALDGATAELLPTAMEETHIAPARLEGEIARTTGQLRMFADVVQDGEYLEAMIDHANPDASPPRPDLRRLLVPVGPVAVFAASNFPFAFSVAGGDTASALAIGCPVVVKAHSGHPELSRLTAAIVGRALLEAGAPEGTFGTVYGQESGIELVQHPAIAAAAFTGSVAGGRALHDLAAGRPAPIPFYGELGSVNPVVITPAAVASSLDALASGLVGSFTLGSGQLCTKPGVVLVPSGSGFEVAVAAAMDGVASGQLLNDRIFDGYAAGLADHASNPAVEVVTGTLEQSGGTASPVVLVTSARAVAADPARLLAETFGPVTLLVTYDDDAQRDAVLDAVEGSLTGTIHAASGEDVAELVSALAERVGRIVFGGWPTGVAVVWSQHHGGPWPATTSFHTSVGATAVRRFQRPLAFQSAPDAVLPAALRESNPLGIPRRVDGMLDLPASG